MKYAITYKQDGIETPKFIFTSEHDVAKEYFASWAGGVNSLDMVIMDENRKCYEACNDGAYSLNEFP